MVMIVFTPRKACFVTALALAVGCSSKGPKYDVHRNVQLTVRSFGSGLVLNAPLSENAAKVSAQQWVQHVGLVGKASSTGIFEQVRMYPGAEDRAEAAIDSSAPVRAVELVSSTSSNITTVQLGLMGTFRGVPQHGCLVPEDPDAGYRDVEYWTAPDSAGGVAILQDWSDQPAPPTKQVLWSVLAWSGPFRGTETLMSPFEPRACDGTNDAIATTKMRATVDAVYRIDRAFKDSIHGARQAVADTEIRERANADVPDACSDPAPEGPTTRHSFPGFAIELPADFTVRDLERTNRRALYWGTEVYHFTGSDGATIEIKSGRDALLPHGVGGMVTAHCDQTLSGHTTHIELMNASTGAGKPRLLVNAHFLGKNGLDFEAEVSSQARQRALMHAIHTLQIGSQWGEASADAKATPNRNPPP
jgi:hypothetical protein